MKKIRFENIIVIAPGDDLHALSVKSRIEQIYAGEVKCIIFDVATYPIASNIQFECIKDVSLDFEISMPLFTAISSSANSILLSRDNNPMKIKGDDHTALYLRRYRHPLTHPAVKVSEFIKFCQKVNITMVISALNSCRTVNPIYAEDLAEKKPYQLWLAKRAGLDIPATLITNEKSKVLKFIAELERNNKKIIYKHTSSLPDQGIITRTFTQDDISRLETLSYASAIFQEKIVGMDYRIVIVDDIIFSCEWRAEEYRDVEDVRMIEDARMWSAPIPQDLKEKLQRFHSLLGLNIGVYDLKRDMQGKFYFLEVNPSGQWLDMEVDGGHHVSASIAKLLVEGRAGKKINSFETYNSESLKKLENMNFPHYWENDTYNQNNSN